MVEVLGLMGFRDYDAIWNCFLGFIYVVSLTT